MTQIQAHISHLRKRLDPASSAAPSSSLIQTRPPGYLIRLAPEQLDLRRFERLTEEAEEASSNGDFAIAAGHYRNAFALWRGPVLADFADDSFSRAARARLEDLRLAALEDRMDVELALGHHAGLPAELEALVADHPLRERLHGQLMLALYRSGRQAEALEAYRRLRRALTDELGLEPSPALQELERAILTQDPSLDARRAVADRPGPGRSILVVASGDANLDALLRIAEPLASTAERELILVRPVTQRDEVATTAAAANARRRELGVTARAAAFTTSDLASDVLRLTTSYDADLVLLDAPGGFEDGVLSGELVRILEHSPAQVAIQTSEVDRSSGAGMFVPFGGGEHDWAALELAAWLALSSAAPLRLVGTSADPRTGRRDSSRLLADASLAVQRLVEVDTVPLLCEPTEDALVDAVADASAVVVGISPRWQREGIGASRLAILRSGVPVVLVHSGLRPGGLAPLDSHTRFTWTLRG